MTGKKLFTTIDEYIRTFPADIRAILEKVRQAIQKAAPEATETISYDGNPRNKIILTSQNDRKL